VPRAEPEPQPVLELARDDVQVQVRHGLADHVVDQDHRAADAEAILDGPLQALRCRQEFGRQVRWQVGQQPDMPPGNQERVPPK
jgi:hypothetical protein